MKPEDGKEAIAALEQVLRKARPAHAVLAAQSLWILARHPDAVPRLCELVALPKEITAAHHAARVLGDIGPEAKVAISHLEKALKDSQGIVNVQAAEALWKICKHPQSIPSLVIAMDDKRSGPYYRHQVARVLGNIGPEAREAIPALQKAHQEREELDTGLRPAVQNALRQINPNKFK